MREGWQVRTLAEACQIKPPKAEARRSLAGTDLVSFVPMGDLGIDQKILVPTQTKPLADVAGSYTYFADGDVLLAKITPCFENGKLGIAANLTNGIGFGSSEYIVFRPGTSVDKEWLYYLLSRKAFRLEGAGRMTGAVGHKRVAKEFIESYPILVPPLPEQKRIVAILDEAFAAIATAAANTEKNLANARELFESELNRVFSQKGDGWVTTTLGDSCNYRNGKAHEKIIDDHGHYIVVNSKFISSNGSSYKRTNNALSLLQVNEIAMVLSDVPNGKALAKCFLVDQDERYTLNQRICAITSEKYSPKFLFYQLNRNAHLLGFNNGENQTNLRKSQVMSCPMFIPSSQEQQSIVERIDAFSENIKRLQFLYQQKLTALTELKQSILHKAFTGELTANPSPADRTLAEAGL